MRATRDYQPPTVTTDVVGFRFEGAELEVLLVRRERAPHAGELALPGVYVHRGVALSAEAYRALEMKGGVAREQVRLLDQVRTFDDPSRDARGPALSIAHIAVVRGGATTGGQRPAWFALHRIPLLAFDHTAIVRAARDWLGERLWHDRRLLPALFEGESVTLPVLQRMNELLTGEALDRRNFARKVAQFELAEEVGEVREGGRGRPAKAWRFRAAPVATHGET